MKKTAGARARNLNLNCKLAHSILCSPPAGDWCFPGAASTPAATMCPLLCAQQGEQRLKQQVVGEAALSSFPWLLSLSAARLLQTLRPAASTLHPAAPLALPASCSSMALTGTGSSGDSRCSRCATLHSPTHPTSLLLPPSLPSASSTVACGTAQGAVRRVLRRGGEYSAPSQMRAPLPGVPSTSQMRHAPARGMHLSIRGRRCSCMSGPQPLPCTPHCLLPNVLPHLQGPPLGRRPPPLHQHCSQQQEGEGGRHKARHQQGGPDVWQGVPAAPSAAWRLLPCNRNN